ncbi:MAG: type II toxin-antitoxin system VapC family toxin [Isosphaeraceae bacterium]
MTERALIDTGPLVALYHDQDPHHARCRAALARLAPPLLTAWPVLTEAAWLLRKRPDALKAVFRGFGSGLFALLPLDGDDLAGIAAILARFETTGIQLTDASLAHLADREGIRTVFTTDRRDFSVIRLKRNRALRLIPDAP